MTLRGSNQRPDANAPAEHGDLREKWLRARADLENYRRRVGERVRREVRDERRGFLLEMIEVLDSVDEALRATNGSNPEATRGMKALRRQMMGVLKRFGAKPVKCMGAVFDPERHEAVGRSNDPSFPAGRVTHVRRRGYAFADGAVLRPAHVIVNDRRGKR